MPELQDYQPSQLIRLLANETINYYKLIGDNANIEECIQCNNRIRMIRNELDSRRKEDEQFFQRPIYSRAS